MGAKPRHQGRGGRSGLVGRGNDAGAAKRWEDFEDIVGDAVGAALLAADLAPEITLIREPTYSKQLDSIRSPIGGGEILFSGSEPVSPNDCALWPDSPLCGGSVVDPGAIGLYGPEPAALNISVSISPTEVLVQIDPSIFGVNLPPLWLGFRRDGAQKIVEDYWAAGPLMTKVTGTQHFGGRGGEVVWFLAADRWKEQSFSPNSWTAELIEDAYKMVVFASVPPVPVVTIVDEVGTVFFVCYRLRTAAGEWAAFKEDRALGRIVDFKYVGGASVTRAYSLFRGSVSRTTKIVSSDPPPVPDDWGYQWNPNMTPYGVTIDDFVYYQNGGRSFQASSLYPQSAVRINFIGVPLNPPPQPPPPPALPPRSPALPPPENDPMPCDCKKLEKLLKEIKKLATEIHEVAGFKEFPVTTPASFYGEDGSTVKHRNIPSLVSWTARQIDAVGGEFPAKIRALNQEGEEVTIKIDNVAEGIVELYGLLAKASIDADFAVRASMSGAAEAQAAKNAAIVAQEYAVANSEHLGYRGNPVRRKIKTAINIKAESPKDFLKPQSVEIVGWEYQDKGTVKEDLMSLRGSGGIIKSVFAKTADQIVSESLRGLGNKEADSSQFDKLLSDLQDPQSPANQGFPPPRIVKKESEKEQNPR